MALRITDGGDEVIVVSNQAAIDSLTSFTTMSWATRSAKSSLQRLWVKHTLNDDNTFRRGAAEDDLAMVVQQSGSISQWESSGGVIPTLSTWYCMATYYDQSATPTSRIYVGTLTTPLAEVAAYTAASTSGSGSKTTENSGDLRIGNRNGNDRSWAGDIAIHHLEAGILTLGEMQSWQFRPRPLLDTRWFGHLGFNGALISPNLCGSGAGGGTFSGSGTATGVVSHVPLGPYSGFDIAAGGASAPPAYEQVSFRFRNDDGALTELA